MQRPRGRASLKVLFAIEPERLGRRPVVHGEKNGVVGATVLVEVRAPGRDEEDVALRPLERLAVDGRRARSAEDVVQRVAEVAVCSGPALRSEDLETACEARECGAAANWM